MVRNTYIEQLEEYFNRTPIEQQEKDYYALREFNRIGPTVDEYIRQLDGNLEMQIVGQSIMNPEFSLDSFILV